jgi:hypothetical protein
MVVRGCHLFGKAVCMECTGQNRRQDSSKESEHTSRLALDEKSRTAAVNGMLSGPHAEERGGRSGGRA